jgi:predicted metal-dependent HD superfamily phosphohydrolase
VEYASNILKEYLPKIKNEKELKLKRIEFLKKMLTFKSLYFTKEMKIFEEKAAMNMKEEIDSLNKFI